MITITRLLEADVGHRLMNHEGKCAHAHGLDRRFVGGRGNIGEEPKFQCVEFSHLYLLCLRRPGGARSPSDG